jgi:hypothetical protein
MRVQKSGFTIWKVAREIPIPENTTAEAGSQIPENRSTGVSYPLLYLLSTFICCFCGTDCIRCPVAATGRMYYEICTYGTGGSVSTLLSLSPVARSFRVVLPPCAFICYCCRAWTISSIFIPREPLISTTSPSLTIERRASVQSLFES